MLDRYRDMLDGKDEPEKKEELGLNSRVLLVDSLNTFMRAFAVIRHVNPNLVPIGGLTGYLRSIGYAIDLVRPTRIILVFDGRGSSTNKRYIYPQYKANRGINRITNWDMFDNQEQESEAITNQLVRLIDYLKCLPVDIVSIDKIEADDVIGRLCSDFKGEVTIMSSDRDFLQLVNHRVTVYSPTKKKFYNKEAILQEYGVTPQNFLLQKMLLGDKGDNVPGVNKLGPKTLIKEFPELAKESIIELDEILEKCEAGKKSIHESILNFKNQLEINRKLMDLHQPNISEDDLSILAHMIENPNKELDTQQFIKFYNEDLLGNSIGNVQTWLYNKFNEVSKYKK
jgi:5'-3' exonuclease